MGKSVSFKWIGKKYESAVVRETKAAIRRCANMVRKTTVINLSNEGQTLPNSVGLNKGKAEKRYARGSAMISEGYKQSGGRSPSFKNAAGEMVQIDRLYWNATERRWVQASVPGTPPNKQSGALRRSIGIQYTSGGLQARVGPRDGLKYARVQELGGKTDDGATLPPRPYLVPALNQNQAEITRILRYAIVKAGSIL